jgi:succinate dehydrogenase / fumarate reductase cytochrome b subunit
MNWLTRFLTSIIGLKVVMATTGLMMVGFVIFHMLGNLQIFLGPEPIQYYADHVIRFWPEALWAARAGLLGAVVAHIASAMALVKRSGSARPVAYGKYSFLNPRMASRVMRIGGVVLLAFIVFHILHLTVGLSAIHPSFQEGKVFHNVTTGLGVWWVALFYIVAQSFLGLHLAHGIWSGCRTLGLSNPRWDALARNAGIGIAVVVAGGNILIPAAILIGLVK